MTKEDIIIEFIAFLKLHHVYSTYKKKTFDQNVTDYQLKKYLVRVFYIDSISSLISRPYSWYERSNFWLNIEQKWVIKLEHLTK